MTSAGGVRRSGNITKEQSSIFKWSLPYPLSTIVSYDERRNYKCSPSFQFSGHSWFLKVYPERHCSGPYCTSLFLEIEKCDPEDSVSVTFILSLEKDGGGVTKWLSSNFNEHNLSNGWSTFSRYLRRCSDPESWTITCYIMSTELDQCCLSEPVLFKKLNTLSTNFKELFASGKNSDITIKVRDSEFPAHKAILAARLPTLAAAFEHDTLENQTGVINIEDCCEDSFRYFLEYLYSGTIGNNCSWSNILDLYIIADKYDEKDLKRFCLSHLMQNLTVENVFDMVRFADHYNEQDLKRFCFSHLMLNLTVENVFEVVRLADEYDEARLMDSAQSFFAQNFNRIILSSEWETLLKDNYRLANKLLRHLALSNGDQLNK